MCVKSLLLEILTSIWLGKAFMQLELDLPDKVRNVLAVESSHVNLPAMSKIVFRLLQGTSRGAVKDGPSEDCSSYCGSRAHLNACKGQKQRRNVSAALVPIEAV